MTVLRSFSIEGKTALVTGCSRGIGFAMAEGLAEAGANIIGVSASLPAQGSAIADAVPVPVIASGGVGTLDHLVEGVTEGHASAVLAASIFHFGDHSIREAKEHMAKAGVPVRLDA